MNATNAASVRTSTSGSSSSPAAMGAASTSTFLIHWRGRHALSSGNRGRTGVTVVSSVIPASLSPYRMLEAPMLANGPPPPVPRPAVGTLGWADRGRHQGRRASISTGESRDPV